MNPLCLNLGELLDLANRSADLTKDAFLSRLPSLCYQGKLHVTGMPCAVELSVLEQREWSVLEQRDFALFKIAGRSIEEIPLAAWPRLHVSFDWGGCASFGNPDAPTPSTMEPSREGCFDTWLWLDLLFNRAQAEAIWPEPRQSASANGKRACQEWLEKLRRDHHEQPKSKQALQVEAEKKFNVGTWQFRSVWEAATTAVPNAGWNRAGARKKS
jgi:hypothetical protein